ncbi:ThiF family adenylyltransferase [Leisingera caerulea]|uniref:ThiF family adenylyltransferase n=1 Tax=Leisingera caerulea TaxID=506591 RepID=A0ABY5WSY3_LEICA|nr:ThiF family adenylyltransferase [Leisingera caerulea]UWQ57288.1 ThiF family adenylyltransferase [Leisingera caerulea]
MTRSFTLTWCQHEELRRMLFPGDGLESAAILICRYTGPDRDRLIVSEILDVPDSACAVRKPDFISWPGASIEKAIDMAEQQGDAIVLVHSHPGGWLHFSKVDDASDRTTMPSLFAANEADGYYHGSAIMTPDGAMKVRVYNNTGELLEISRIWRIGNSITDVSAVRANPVMPFGSQMTDDFGRQSACVIGVSGTGSLVAELLARKGIGHLILIDFDTIEHKNLNRIVNSTVADADANRAKTRMMADAIARYAPQTRVTTIDKSIDDRDAVIAASSADILFSCVDSMAGRSMAELLSRCCLIPMIDLGVTIPTRRDAYGCPHVADVCGRIDVVRPDGPNLTDRGVVTAEGLRREYLLESAPEAARREIDAGYIKGIHEEAPSVMALNMRAASDAVLEWIERQYPYRLDGNEGFARTLFSHAAGEVEFYSDDDFTCGPIRDLGRGLVEPLLGLPGLAQPDRKDAA